MRPELGGKDWSSHFTWQNWIRRALNYGRLSLSTNAPPQVKLLREVEMELLSNHQQTLLQKEHSGAAALLRDDKVWACSHARHEYMLHFGSLFREGHSQAWKARGRCQWAQWILGALFGLNAR